MFNTMNLNDKRRHGHRIGLMF